MVGAAAQWEDSLEGVERLVEFHGAGEGADVRRAILLVLVDDLRAGPGVALVDAHGDEGLVVLEVDVVARFMKFDQIVFEDEGLFFVGRNHALDARCQLEHDGNLDAPIAVGAEIAAKAISQHLGLTDIEHLARIILEQIAARIARRALDVHVNGVVECHKTLA